MNEIGLFEAKTKFSSLCDSVSKSGEPVTVNRRGVPLVQIIPIKPAKGKTRTLWEDVAAWERDHPNEDDVTDFPEVWKPRTQGAQKSWVEDE